MMCRDRSLVTIKGACPKAAATKSVW